MLGTYVHVSCTYAVGAAAGKKGGGRVTGEDRLNCHYDTRCDLY